MFNFFDYSKDKDKELALLFLWCLKTMVKTDTIEDNEGEPFILPAGSFIANYSDIAHHMKSTRRKITADLERLEALGLIAVNNFPEKGYTFRYTFPNTFPNTFFKVISVTFQGFNVELPQQAVQKLVHFSEHKSEHFSHDQEKIPLDSPPKKVSPPLYPSPELLKENNIAPLKNESSAFVEPSALREEASFFKEEEVSGEDDDQIRFDGLFGAGEEKNMLIPAQEENTKPKTKEQSPEQQRNIERALWRDGLWHFCRFYYLERGLNPALYSKLTPAMNGILNRTIEKLGHGDWALGVKWAMVYIVAASMRFDQQKDQGYSGEYWTPTLDNLMQNKKLIALQGDAAEYDLPEIAENAKEFRDQCRADTDMFEKSLTGGAVQ